jgi:hypothetical protein
MNEQYGGMLIFLVLPTSAVMYKYNHLETCLNTQQPPTHYRITDDTLHIQSQLIMI